MLPFMKVIVFITCSSTVYGRTTSVSEDITNALEEDEEIQVDPAIVCYYNASAIYRRQPMNYHVTDIPGELCTHIIYAFADIHSESMELLSLDSTRDIENGLFRQFTNLKYQYPHVKTLLSIGGWKASQKYSNMVTWPENRKRFVTSALQWILEYGFDGIDLFWMNPGNRIFGRETDKENYCKLIEELKNVLLPHGFILTIAVPKSISALQVGFNIQEIARIADHIHFLSYNFRTGPQYLADVHSPLYGRPGSIYEDYERENVHYTVLKLEEMGVPPSKLIVGLAFYGYTHNLKDANQNAIMSLVCGGGPMGPYTAITRNMAYYEICTAVSYDNSTKRFDDTVKCPYLNVANKWVGYEDEESLRHKINFVREKSYAGVLVWTVDMDDFRGLCGDSNILLKTINDQFERNIPPIQISELLPTTMPDPFDIDCKESFNEGRFFPHETDCQKYYACFSGWLVLEICPSMSLFDTERNSCNWKYVVNRSECT